MPGYVYTGVLSTANEYYILLFFTVPIICLPAIVVNTQDMESSLESISSQLLR